MPTLATLTEEGAYGLVHPCILKCADPCVVDCCCAELGIAACAKYWDCGETDTDPVCKPNRCNYWSEVRFYGITIPACLTKRADAHGGLAQVELFIGDACATAAEMEPGWSDRVLLWPASSGGTCESPVVTLSREDIMGYLCSTCAACADYKVAFVFRAADDTVLLCCEWCMRLCDVLCPYDSSSSSSSSSPAPPPP